MEQMNGRHELKYYIKGSSSQFVNELMGIAGVANATLVSYNGDYYM